MRLDVRRSGRCCLVMFAAAAAFAGCGKAGVERAEVRGEVTFDDEPVDDGTITLVPAEGTTSSGSGGFIKQGTYVIERAKGPTPGNYLVQIVARRETGREIPAGPPAPPDAKVKEVKQYIPAKYNTQTTLRIEITPGKNLHDFQLRTENGQ